MHVSTHTSPYMCSNRGIQCGMFQKTDTCSVEGNRPRSLSIYSFLSSSQLTHSTSHTQKRRAWATEQEAKSTFTRPGKGPGGAWTLQSLRPLITLHGRRLHCAHLASPSIQEQVRCKAFGGPHTHFSLEGILWFWEAGNG